MKRSWLNARMQMSDSHFVLLVFPCQEKIVSLFWFLNIQHRPKVTVLRYWST